MVPSAHHFRLSPRRPLSHSPARAFSPFRFRRRRSGYAMLAVLVFLAVSLIFIGVGQRRISSQLQLERARIEVEDFNEGPAQAMAKALKLLETGVPATTPYECGVSLSTSAGVRLFSVRFTQSGTNQWSVQVAPIETMGSLPSMPAVFPR
jgi:hypothetical protein